MRSTLVLLLLLYLAPLAWADTYTLENDTLLVSIESDEFILTFTDKRNGEIRQTREVWDLEMQQVDSTASGYTFYYQYTYETMPLSIQTQLHGNTVTFEVKADSSLPMGDVFSCPGLIPSHSDEYMIIPYASGIMIPAAGPISFWLFEMWAYKATMSFVGMTDLTSGYMITSDSPWDTEIEFLEAEGNVTFAMHHHPSKGRFGYDRRFHYTFFDQGGYVAICDWYRQHVENMGYVRPFTEKVNHNPNIDKLIGAADIWTIMLAQDTTFINDLVYSGIDRAIISLYGGWQPEPVATPIVTHINNMGLLSSRYDIYTDVWPNDYPDDPDIPTYGYPQDVIVNADQSLREGWLTYLWDGTPFQGYYTCSATHAEHARQFTGEDLAVNPYNCRFMDVEMATQLYECWSGEHPVTRQQDAMHRRETLQVFKDEFGLVTGSEEARDWAFDITDYGEGTMTIYAADNAGYNWATPIDNPGDNYHNWTMNPRARLPLLQLVYGDCFAPTWYTGDGISKVTMYWDRKEALTLLYGAMLNVMPPDREYWDVHRQRYLSSMHTTSAVFRATGYALMTNHEFLTSDKLVQRTTFDNGWQVTANFSAQNYTVADKVLPANGFYADNGNEQVYRGLKGSDTLTVVLTADRLFLNPHAGEQSHAGIRSDGAVFLQEKGDYIHLAFIGEQSQISINPDALPWPVSNPVVHTMTGDSSLSLHDNGDGWLTLQRLAGERYYRLQSGGPTAVQEQAAHARPDKTKLRIYPNPFNPATQISYHISGAGHVNVSVYNTLGQRVITLVDQYQSAGQYQVRFERARLASGLYFVRLTAGEEVVTSKVMLMN